MIPTSAAPTDIGNDGRGVTAPGCRVRQSKLHDSLRALSGIRLPTRSAIGAGPMTGKANSMKKRERTHFEGLLEEVEARHDRQDGSSVATTLNSSKPKRSPAQIAHSTALFLKWGPAAVKASVAKRRSKTTCKRGHLLAGDNLYVDPRGKRGCRACRFLASKKYKSKPPTERQVRALFEGLREGKTLSFLTGGIVRESGIKSYRYDRIVLRPEQLQQFRFANRSAARLIDKLAKQNEFAARSRGGHATTRLRRLRSGIAAFDETAFSAIVAATESLPDFVRDDVRSLMFEAAVERRLTARDAAKRVREFVTAHNRQFSKFVPGGGGIMRSLDEQVYDDGPTRLVDIVTHGLWQ